MRRRLERRERAWSWRLPGSRPCETTDLPRMRGPASCPAFRIHTWFTVEGLK